MAGESGPPASHMLSTATGQGLTVHSENFPDPTMSAEGLMRVWFVSAASYIFVSVDTLREARLVLKTISALTGLTGPKTQGLQWYRPDQGWVEWSGGEGETIHDLPDSDAIFARPSRTRLTCH